MRLVFSLRFKLISGMAVMLLPMLLIASIAFYALQQTNQSLESLADEVIEEMPRAGKIKSLIMMAQMPPNDYIVSGNNAEQNTFGYFVEQVDEAIFQLNNSQRKFPQQTVLASLLKNHWADAKKAAGAIFSRDDPQMTPELEDLLGEFDAHIGKAISLLNQVERHSFKIIDEERNAATSWTYSLYLTIAASLFVGLGIASFAGYRLGKMVLGPLGKLATSAEKIGKGEFETIPLGEQHDEFTQVMETFNIMAINLKQNQAVLQDMAMRDGLTGLLNRREFHRILTKEIDRASRQRSSVSVLMLDIDYFKRVNDSYGHQIGDEVLKTVATLLGQQIRTMDSVARYGGEEFVIITPETGAGAEALAERIRQVISAQFIPDGSGGQLQVTISIGLANYPKHANDEHELVNKADQALYLAKEQGRNRVCSSVAPQQPNVSAKVIRFDPPTRG